MVLASPMAESPSIEEARPVRLLLIRHAQSANKEKRFGDRADKDPGLTDLGFEQAELLGERLERSCRPGSLLVVSSPMRRCLLTIQPAVYRLELKPDVCVCHGGCYEYGCAGTGFPGTSWEEIAAEYPEFSPLGFTSDGFWDYRGCNEKESDSDCRDRAQRIASWLVSEAVPMLRLRSVGRGLHTIILVTHQTLADVLCQLLVNGTADGWVYGEIRFRLGNTGISEFFLHPDGHVQIGHQNDLTHVRTLRGRSQER